MNRYSGIEKRRDPREPDKFSKLRCLYNGGSTKRVKDVSFSGIAVVLEDISTIREGARATLDISTVEGKQLATIKGHIVRTFQTSSEYGIGIEFDIRHTKDIEKVLDYLNGTTVRKE